MASMLSYLRIPFFAISGLTTFASGLLYLKQNELIYPRYLPTGARTEEGVPAPAQFGISEASSLKIPTPDGEVLHAYLIQPSNKAMARPLTVMMFHGNAGNIGHRLPIAKVIEENMGCSVFMLEYRGYGLSTGTPDEKGLRIDAQTGLDYLRQLEQCQGHDFIVYGQSLGGAVATRLVADDLVDVRNEEKASHGRIMGLILENTFTSMRKLIPSVMPPAKYIAWLCHQAWETEQILPQITKVPILFLTGLKDEIIPPEHMRQLRTVCKAKDITWRELPNGNHNESVTEPNYFIYMFEFIKSKCLRP